MMMSVSQAGNYVGAALAFGAGAWIQDQGKDQPTPWANERGLCPTGISYMWPYVFYSTSVLGMVWCVVWILFMSPTPAQDDNISEAELAYITANVKKDADQVVSTIEVTKSESAPWLGFMTTPEAHALFLAMFVYYFCQFSTEMFLTKYYSEVWSMGLEQSGDMAAMPNMFIILTSLSTGWLADRMIQRYFSVTHTRVLLHFLFCGGVALFQNLSGSAGSSTQAVVAMTAAIAFFSMAHSSICINYTDISPHYASTLFSIGNAIANTGALVGLIVLGEILGNKSQPAKQNWLEVFRMLALMLALSWVAFAAFGSGKPVPALN